MTKGFKDRTFLYILLIAAAFTAWSAVFIYRSSSIAIDGKRYFSLFDDAMISMRYAWNFAHGLGLVWNSGERVQGYSNLLMTLWMSVPAFFLDKSNSVLFIQIFGIPVLLANAYMAMLVAEQLLTDRSGTQRNLIKILGFAVPLLYYPLVYWTLMGMETGLQSLCLLLSIFFASIYAKRGSQRTLFFIALFTGIGVLIRMDMLVFALPLWAFIFWVSPKKKRGWVAFGYLGLMLFVAALLLFQFRYYGDWLPNTYTLKMAGIPAFARIANGSIFVTPFLVVTAFVLVLSFLDLIFDFDKFKLLLFSFVFVGIGYQIYVGGDVWQRWRMLAPFVPVLFLLFIFSSLDIVNALSKSAAYKYYALRRPIFAPKSLPGILSVVVIMLGIVTSNSGFLYEALQIQLPYATSFNAGKVNVALLIKEMTTENATIGVSSAGTIPYYSGRWAFDFLGKNDKYIAQLRPELQGGYTDYGMNYLPGHNKYNLRYSIRRLEPTYVEIFAWGSESQESWGLRNYVVITYEGLTLFFLKGSPDVLWDKAYELNQGVTSVSNP